MKWFSLFDGVLRRPPTAGAFVSEGIWANHYFEDLEHYALEGYFFDTKRLIVTFEHAASDQKSDAYRHGWGSVYLRKQRISHICIKPKANHWYQQPGLAEALANLKDQGLFDQFDHRMTYGGSMGGFGALVFADDVKADTVLALNPQSTLRRIAVPWERRWPEARLQKWNGPYSDAKGKAQHPAQVIVVYDPHVRGDMRQAKRLTSPGLIEARAPFIGHGLTRPLTEMKILTPMLLDASRGQFDLPKFHKDLRVRRSTKKYYHIMERRRRVVKSPAFSKCIERYKAAFSE